MAVIQQQHDTGACSQAQFNNSIAILSRPAQPASTRPNGVPARITPSGNPGRNPTIYFQKATIKAHRTPNPTTHSSEHNPLPTASARSTPNHRKSWLEAYIKLNPAISPRIRPKIVLGRQQGQYIIPPLATGTPSLPPPSLLGLAATSHLAGSSPVSCPPTPHDAIGVISAEFNHTTLAHLVTLFSFWPWPHLDSTRTLHDQYAVTSPRSHQPTSWPLPRLTMPPRRSREAYTYCLRPRGPWGHPPPGSHTAKVGLAAVHRHLPIAPGTVRAAAVPFNTHLTSSAHSPDLRPRPPGSPRPRFRSLPQ